MVSKKTITRLCWHAGLSEGGGQDVPSVASTTWPEGHLNPGFRDAMKDCLKVISALNFELNHPGAGVSDMELPRVVAYAVVTITLMIRDSQYHSLDQHEAAVLDRFAWRIEAAWAAVLAGDIEDIEEILILEESARFPDAPLP